MSDETPVPETLETIAASIRDLRTSMDERFTKVDERFTKVDERFGKVDQQFAKIDTRFDELRSQLRTDIEAVRGDIRLVAEATATQHKRDRRNDADHKRFKTQLEDHDVRLLTLERKTPRT